MQRATTPVTTRTQFFQCTAVICGISPLAGGAVLRAHGTLCAERCVVTDPTRGDIGGRCDDLGSTEVSSEFDDYKRIQILLMRPS